jgi:hypothetical protein
MNNLASDIRHWSGNVDAKGHWLLDVGGVECLGDVNVHGTFRVNGIPITAFRPVPEKVIEKIIEPKVVIERKEFNVEPGDNISIDRSGDSIKINSDPGDWQEYYPRVDGARVKGNGQYIVYGPICFVQIYFELNRHIENSVRVSLPFHSRGPVKQSLTVGVIEGDHVILVPEKETYINGAYRIA